MTFCFFHSVTDLVPSADGATIETILIDQQCALAPGGEEYDPLLPVKGIDCWPSSPRWEQILNGPEFAAEGVNFEEYYSPQPPPAAKLRLERGQNFDQVILGIPIGALATICKGLVDQKPAGGYGPEARNHAHSGAATLGRPGRGWPRRPVCRARRRRPRRSGRS